MCPFAALRHGTEGLGRCLAILRLSNTCIGGPVWPLPAEGGFGADRARPRNLWRLARCPHTAACKAPSLAASDTVLQGHKH